MGERVRTAEDLGGYSLWSSQAGGVLEPSNLRNSSLLSREPWQENTSHHPAAFVVFPSFQIKFLKRCLDFTCWTIGLQQAPPGGHVSFAVSTEHFSGHLPGEEDPRGTAASTLQVEARTQLLGASAAARTPPD